MKIIGKNKKIQEAQQEYFDKNKEDQIYVCNIKKKSKQRTLPQNSLFHVLFEIIKQEENKLGNPYSFNDIKEMMKKALIGVKTVGIGKFQTEISKKGTSDLSEKEGIDFITKILYFLEQHYSIKIESMEDKRLLEFYDKYIFGK